MSKAAVSENSERKRISIPRADESVLAWWDAQTEPGLSIRILIRDEIKRNGYTDTAYRHVAPLPPRERESAKITAPPEDTSSSERAVTEFEDSDVGGRAAALPAVAPNPPRGRERAALPAAEFGDVGASAAALPATRAERRAAAGQQRTPSSTPSTIDDLMNG